MSETIRNDEELDRARDFVETHVYPPTNYEVYVEENYREWYENAQQAHTEGQPTKPMWLRRNGDSYTHFAAHVDYMMPLPEPLYLASIDISSDGGHSEIQVLMPKDETGEPIAVTSEAYTLAALGRAITYVETAVNLS